MPDKTYLGPISVCERCRDEVASSDGEVYSDSHGFLCYDCVAYYENLEAARGPKAPPFVCGIDESGEEYDLECY